MEVQQDEFPTQKEQKIGSFKPTIKCTNKWNSAYWNGKAEHWKMW